MSDKSTSNYLLHCGTNIIDLSLPQVMGILNITPDSFYDGGQRNSITASVQAAIDMHRDGAAIIDIGGQSTRPGAQKLEPQQELDRIAPTIETLVNYNADIVISVDTFHAYVAKNAVALGAAIVNDVSAGEQDTGMIATVATLGVPYIAMHMNGTPATMQQHTTYDDVTETVLNYLGKKLAECYAAGIQQVVIDPGFGFGKTTQQNFQLLQKLHRLTQLKVPMMVGLSRKSMLYKPLQLTPSTALNATTAAHMLALQQGAHLLRVHDVQSARETIEIYKLYTNA
jgi:dihydropteroate synthase